VDLWKRFGLTVSWVVGSHEVQNQAASIAVGLVFLRCPAFLRCGGASLSTGILSTKTRVAYRRIKIERVYRPYLTATEAENQDSVLVPTSLFQGRITVGSTVYWRHRRGLPWQKTQRLTSALAGLIGINEHEESSHWSVWQTGRPFSLRALRTSNY
jgi:hypothetical protein